MKKSLTRILTLALVLAMMVGVMPAALADELPGAAVTLAPSETKLTLQNGVASTQVLAEVSAPTGYTLNGIAWSGATAGAVNNVATFSATAAGTYTVSATASFVKNAENKDETAPVEGTKTASVEITVEAGTDPEKVLVESVSLPATVSVVKGGTTNLEAVVLPENATDHSVTWISGNETIATVADGVVSGISAGETTITATANDGSGKFATCIVKVTDKYTLEADNMSLAVGETKTLSVTVKDVTTGQLLVNPSVQAEVVTGKEFVEQTGLTFKGKKAGTVTVNLTYSDGTNTATGTATITVSDGLISCDNQSVAASDYGKTVTLSPRYGASGSTLTDITFTFERVGSTGTVIDNKNGTATVACTGAGLVQVKITAKSGTDVVGTKTVYVSFYKDVDIEVTMKGGIKSFAFNDASALNGGTALQTLMRQSLNTTTMTSADVAFSKTSTANVGRLVLPRGSLTSSTPLNSLGSVQFEVTGSLDDEWTFGYTFLDDGTGLTLGKGTVTIHFSASAGDITYTTDYSTPITFDEDDFEDFWNAYYTAASNTLSYVQFGVSTTAPRYGTLYTTSSKGTKVTSTMKFQPNYRNASGYSDLDAVYYVPSTSYTSAYSVEIPFTAYGGTATKNDTLSGTVVINLNNATTTITSRGVVFGSGTTSIADMMASDYKSETNMDLSYVTFALPYVEDGRLFYDYTGILNSSRVDSKDKFYVSAGRNELDLEKVTFIPAAGKTGKVTLSYTGYDKNGNNPYSGKIVLTVTAKTKSVTFTDVTTTYSWAADSIDFLYYEDVVNGTSSTKFGPSASITRGDFMIMLYRAFLESDYKNHNVTSNFADVTKGTTTYSQETYQAVGVAKYLGIAKGDGTKFNPKSSITREEAMTLIYRTLETVKLDLEYTTSKTTSSFTDYSSVSSYARDSISYLIRHGIVIGSNNKISPKSNITRAEMAVILHRVLTY